jgi:hypothetical protein
MKELEARFRTLKDMLEARGDRARAGYEFEIFLQDLFLAEHIRVVPPQTRTVDQIDGAFLLDNAWYLYEAKWRVGRTDVQMIDHFAESIRRGFSGAASGFFFSYAGFTKNAIDAAHAQTPRSVILCDGEDLELAITEDVPLIDILRAKIQAASVRGEIYYKLEVENKGRRHSAMTLAAIGSPIVMGCALGPVIIYDRSLTPKTLSALSESIVVAVFDDEDLNEGGKYETWQLESLLPTLRGAIFNIGGGGDHFSGRVFEKCFRMDKRDRPAVVGGLFDKLYRDRQHNGVVLGGQLLCTGTIIAIDGGSIYMPSERPNEKCSRALLENEAAGGCLSNEAETENCRESRITF